MLLLLVSFETFLYIGIYSILHMYIFSTGTQTRNDKILPSGLNILRTNFYCVKTKS